MIMASDSYYLDITYMAYSIILSISIYIIIIINIIIYSYINMIYGARSV